MNETSPQTTSLYELLMARIRALEADMASLREEMAYFRSEGFEEANEDYEMQCGGTD